MDFFAKVTKPSQGTQETIEKKRVRWNAGLSTKDLQFLTDDSRARMSAGRKGKPWSTEHRAKLSQSCKTKKAVMTYYGPFESVTAVARASGYSRKVVGSWIRKYPEHYYYV